MINLLSKASHPSHRIRLTVAFCKDIHWWQTFLTSWNGCSFFYQDTWLPNSSLQLFTDASHAAFGAYFAGKWFSCSFSAHRIPLSRSITFKELQRTSHVRTTCSFDQLQVNAQEYFRSGLADSTHRTYTAAQRQFLSFCDTYGLSPLPASEDTLILFVMHLAARIKPQSISVYLAGIRSLHVANGYSNLLLPGLRLKQTLCKCVTFELA